MIALSPGRKERSSTMCTPWLTRTIGRAPGVSSRRMESVNIRRHTIRTDGFVSLHAGSRAGEVTTKPFVFSGDTLELNYATSAVGSVKAELRDAENRPIPGLTLADCREHFGDLVDGEVTWTGGAKLGGLAGKPVRLHLSITDADVYAFRFR